MVLMLLHAYSVGMRSSPRIERPCWEEVAILVLTVCAAPENHADTASGAQALQASGRLGRCLVRLL